MSGRKTGSKNKPGHSAGGVRANAGRKSNAEAARIAEEKRRKAEQEAARKAADRNKRAKEEEKKRRNRKVQRERAEKQAISSIRRSARLQLERDLDVLCRQEEYGDGEDDANDQSTIADDSTDDKDELDEENDDESDDEEDYATEEGGDDITKERRTRQSNRYMPPKDSPLGLHLDQFQREIADVSTGKKMSRKKKKMWYGPGDDPSASASSIRNPNGWYTHRRKFVWMPIMQFSHVLSWANLGCPFGCDNPSMESKGLTWRPMFNFGDVVWLLHQRVHCKNCSRKCSSIHPDFLALLPTRIVDRLPFITMPSGPGFHRDMTCQLNSLMNKQILWGSYANSINELQKIKCDEGRLSFLDAAAETAPPEEIAQQYQIDPLSAFSDFNEAGCWNGVNVTVAMVKAAHSQYMKAKEPYMQRRFQLTYDEAVTTDHSHKLAGVTRASGRPGVLFGASYTMASHQGLVNVNRFTMTKSNAEIKPVVVEHKGERARQGIHLKRHETDHIGGDGVLMQGVFKEELSAGVKPPVVANPSYPVATVARESVSHANTVNTTGVSPVSIGLVERLMTTCYWCRHVGGEGCDPMGSAVQVQVLVLCTFSTDPGRINTPSQQCLT